MNRAELKRRMATIPYDVAHDVMRMVRDGYGASGIVNNAPVTLKQANACFEWRERYGRVLPGATDCAVMTAEGQARSWGAQVQS